MIRSVVAVVAGYATFIVLTTSVWLAFGYGPEDVPSDSFLLLSLAFETPFALAAGYLSAWIADRREARHSAVLATAMALHGVVGLVAGIDAYPVWVHVSTLLVLAPCCYLGGRIRQWQVRSRAEAELAH